MKLYKKDTRWNFKIGKRHIHGPHLWQIFKAFIGLKCILIAFLLSSCSQIVINGVQVKRSHQRVVIKGEDIAKVAACVAVGVYLKKNVINTQK